MSKNDTSFLLAMPLRGFRLRRNDALDNIVLKVDHILTNKRGISHLYSYDVNVY